MPVSSVRNTCFFCIGTIGVICLSIQIAMAGDSNLFHRISPHISLSKNTPSQELGSFSINKKFPVGEYLAPEGNSTSPPPQKSLRAQDLFSLAMGARFQVSDWLGVDAACSMPFTEDENIETDNLSIEAMVTMQF